ncbi:MAG: (2Fe-2S)-binding protein [Pseudomonadales bacterium]|nr:(2Fe-2S)-binding protein [Pseudomonadales bacterium]MBO6703585.1 (2Fe-2S)-binding protein [Pseudomonadales bacterium]MBO7004358.1 (2Fe-2S)-binding protein [Pseudomonadales bacterium]
MAKFVINGEAQEVDVDPSTPLLWVIREKLGMTGTKFGCGMAQCGACTIQIDGAAVRSCVMPVAAAEGRDITTIEGLAPDEETLHPLQAAWIEHQVPQCGYCQSGQLMSAAALLAENPNPSDEDIDRAMDGNICRCGMYGRIKAAIKTAANNNAKPLFHNALRKQEVNHG